MTGAGERPTKDEEDDHTQNRHQHRVENANGLPNIAHAGRDRLALSPNLDHLHDHLVQADIAVPVVVQRAEDLLGLLVPPIA